MELSMVFKAIFSLLLVIIILYIVLKLIQKYTNIGYKITEKMADSDSLKLENVVYIDESTKIVTITGSGKRRYVIGVNKNNITLLDKLIDENTH